MSRLLGLLIAWAFALLSASETAPASLRSGIPIDVEIGGKDRELTFTYTAAAGGALYVRLRCEETPLVLRARRASGDSIEDAPTKRKSSFLSFEVKEGDHISISVAAPAGAGELRARLEVFEAPETPATLSAAEAADKVLDEIGTLKEARDLDGARKRLAKTVDALLSTPGAASSFAVIDRLGQLEGLAYELQDISSYGRAWKAILDFSDRTLPDDHPEHQTARSNLGLALRMAGDLHGAKALQEKALAVALSVVPDDHKEVQHARLELACTIRFLGDLPGARTLQEKALASFSRSLPDDSFELQMARDNLAATLYQLGDARAAKELQEKVLAVFSRTQPADDLSLQIVRTNLALTLWALGDYGSARVLQEKVLEVLSRTLPEDHEDLQRARDNLAATYGSLGNLEASRKLQEKAVEVYARTRPRDHPELLRFQSNLAATLARMGDLEAARPLLQKVCEARARTFPAGHPVTLIERSNLAMMLLGLNDAPAARKVQEETLEGFARALPDDSPVVLRVVHGYALTLAILGDEKACARVVRRVVKGLRAALDRAELSQSPRELEALAAGHEYIISTILSLVPGSGPMGPLEGLEAEAFGITERARSVASGSFAVLRAGEGDPELQALREASRAASGEVSRLFQSREPDRAERLLDAVRRRDDAERRLRSRLAAVPGGAASPPDFTAAGIAKRLGPREAAVGFHRYRKFVGASDVAYYLAFVLRNGRPLQRIELGPGDEIDDAVAAWLEAIEGPGAAGRASGGKDKDDAALAVSKAGKDLRKLVLDPLRGALGDAKRIIVALDGALHLVPFDALPEDDGYAGDRLEINVRTSLKELTVEEKTPLAGRSLLALGGIDYDVGSEVGRAALRSTVVRGAPVEALRSSGGRMRFAPLPATGQEVDRIAALYRQAFSESPPPVVLKKTAATFEAIERRAPRTRFLHVATHGYFAPDSVPSVADSEPLDSRAGFERLKTPNTEVHRLAPMVLCGLALSGANADGGGAQVVAGVMTAEELSAMDLRGCELAVLSACETNAGCLRAGQGIASLQQALHAGGTRSAVTSLWKVPDRATRKLMEEFYRRIWIDKEPKARALWEAKKRLRDERDAKGKPRHALRDWAGWVLTGEPD